MDRKILLTGGSGALGQAIQSSARFENIDSPSSKELDITNTETIAAYFYKNRGITYVVHAAAQARIEMGENDPIRTEEVNVVGTSNLVQQVMVEESNSQERIRFLFISTDGVYGGESGNYKEDGPTTPKSKYGWSKLAAEGSVGNLPNHCIVRTRFFIPSQIPFSSSADDIYTSQIPVQELVSALDVLLYSDVQGVINVGGPRVSDFDAYRSSKPELVACNREEIQKSVNFMLPKDISMNVSRWAAIKRERDVQI